MVKRIMLYCFCLIIMVACVPVPENISTQTYMATQVPNLLVSTKTPTQTQVAVPVSTSIPVNLVLSDRITLHKSGYLVSYLVSPQEYEAYRDLNAPDPAIQAVQEAYAFFKDDFDFVFVINNEEKDFKIMGNGITFALRTYPEIGLGSLTTFEGGLPYVKVSTPLENETNRLMTMIHFAHRDAIQKGPVLHEMMHRWGNFVLPGPREYAMHWGFSDVGGQLGGFSDLEPTGDGTFHAFNRFRKDKCFSPNAPSGTWDTRNSIPYSPLELYLIGLIGIDEIPSEITILENGRFVDDAACIVSGVKQVYKTEALFRKVRQPGLADSQKTFKILTIVVTRQTLAENEWDHYIHQLEWFEFQGDDDDPSLYNFWEATGGRAMVELGKLPKSLRTQ